jgi:long-subunit acyl-CoA synthetase (AMP-forming)
MGYFKDEAETKRTIDGKGFVHSGDVGMIGKNGSIAITGRIKELLITAGGENVSPILIENVINTVLPIFSHVVVIGDRRKYLACLLCLRLKDSQNLSSEVV